MAFFEKWYKPRFQTGRAAEITAYLLEHPEITSFVILDDENFDWKSYHLSEYWVKSSYYQHGLTAQHADKAIQILQAKQPWKKPYEHFYPSKDKEIITMSTVQTTPSQTILATPNAGWSSLLLNGYRGRLSYLDNIPMMLMDLILEYTKKQSACCTFDCEGYSFTLVLADQEVNIIEHKEKTPEFFPCENHPDMFCKQILFDIEQNLPAWVNTYYYEQEEPLEYKSCMHAYLTKLQECKNKFV